MTILSWRRYLENIQNQVVLNILEISTLKKGSKINITKGKLSKLTAIFVERCSKTRSKVLISLLNNDYLASVDNESIQQIY